MSKKVVRCIEDILAEMQQQQEMSCVPDMPKYRENDVIDEDKSVRWNREQVAARNQARVEAVKELNRKKNEWRDRLVNEMAEAIVNELDGKTSLAAAKKLWNYVYEETHDEHWSATYDKLYEMLDICAAVLKKEDK